MLCLGHRHNQIISFQCQFFFFPCNFYTTVYLYIAFLVQSTSMHFNFNVTTITVQYGELKWKLETQQEICNFEKLKHKFSLAFARSICFHYKNAWEMQHSYSISTACFFGFHIEMHTCTHGSLESKSTPPKFSKFNILYM